MKGVVLEFIENSPFYEQAVFIQCTDWAEFEHKLFKQFESDCFYMQMDCMSGVYNYDAEFRVGRTYYKCNNIVVGQTL